MLLSHTFSYAIANKERKKYLLLTYLQKNNFLNKIIVDHDLHKKLQLGFSWKIVGGYYYPYYDHKPSCDTYKITLSKRQFLFANCYYLMHELIHLHQNKEGRLPFFSNKQDKYFPLPWKPFLEQYLMCEAEATMEAIKISYDLYKYKEMPYGWYGCLYDLQWRFLAQLYEKIYTERGEEEAYSLCYNQWYDGRYVENYRKLAKKKYCYLKLKK